MPKFSIGFLRSESKVKGLVKEVLRECSRVVGLARLEVGHLQRTLLVCPRVKVS